MRFILPVVVWASLGSACTKTDIVVTPRHIHRQVPHLRQHGRADVEVHPGGTRELTLETRLNARFANDARGWLGWLAKDPVLSMSVGELIANCPDVPPFLEDTYRPEPPCLLMETKSQAWKLGEERRIDADLWRGVGYTTLGIGSLVGLGYCAYECDGPMGTASQVALVGLAAGTMLIGMAAVAVFR